MIQEALAYIANLAQRSVEPKRLEIEDPRFAYFVVGNGPMMKTDLPEPPREHAAKQLSDLIELAERFDADYEPVVWYDESAVVLVIDDDSHRCESATLSLVESDLFAVVKGMAKRSFDPRSFMRFLRIELAGALPACELLDIVRKVRFENGTVTSSDVTKSRESLGKSINAAVSADVEIPDDVTLSVPVYKTLGETAEWPIRCTVEADAMQNCFRLIPFPDEIERVQQLAVGSIAERLKSGLPQGLPSYFGNP